MASIDGLRQHGTHPATAGCSRMSDVDLATALAAVLAASQLPAQLASRREMHPVLRFPVTVVDTPPASTTIAGKQDSEVCAHA